MTNNKQYIGIDPNTEEEIVLSFDQFNEGEYLSTDAIVAGSFFQSYDLVKDAIALGNFNINQQNSQGETALYYAMSFENIELAKLLLDNGAKIILDDDGEFPRMTPELAKLIAKN
jgi:ankyrin repeat protein